MENPSAGNTTVISSHSNPAAAAFDVPIPANALMVAVQASSQELFVSIDPDGLTAQDKAGAGNVWRIPIDGALPLVDVSRWAGAGDIHVTVTDGTDLADHVAVMFTGENIS